MTDYLLCLSCGEKVAVFKGDIRGEKAWSPICLDCLTKFERFMK